MRKEIFDGCTHLSNNKQPMINDFTHEFIGFVSYSLKILTIWSFTLVKISYKSNSFTKMLSLHILYLSNSIQYPTLYSCVLKSLYMSYSHLKNITAIAAQTTVTATITVIGTHTFSIDKPRKVDFIN